MIKDYDCTIEYHPGKANVVVDALSRRPESSLSHMKSGYLPLLVDLRALGVILEAEDSGALLATFHEERDRKFHLQMPNLSAGEGRALEDRGEDTVTPYSSMEMGEDHYGFCDRSSTDSEEAQCYMGDS